jgi:hypothetical protein
MTTRPVLALADGAPNSSPGATPREYLPLRKYLADRFADVVVLRFVEIEDLLGCKLPNLARTQPEWWENPDAQGTGSAQSRAWTEAGRTASVNVPATKVTFERLRF